MTITADLQQIKKSFGSLTDAQHWTLWRAVTGEDGKQRKIPIDPMTLKAGNKEDPSKWATLDRCQKAIAAGKCSGIGYMFLDSGLFGVDIDKCIDAVTGCPLPEWEGFITWVQAKLKTYCEYSQSGTGLHFIGKCGEAALNRYNEAFYSVDENGEHRKTRFHYSEYKEAAKANKTGAELEIYVNHWWFTLTGKPAPNFQSGEVITDIRDSGEALTAILTAADESKVNTAPAPANEPQNTEPKKVIYYGRSDDEVLRLLFNDKSVYPSTVKGTNSPHAKAGKNKGAERKRLYYEGADIGADDSSEDMDILHGLMFWSGCDRKQVDRLFRQSALMRDKWERQGYRDLTLNKIDSAIKGAYRVEHISNHKTEYTKDGVPLPYYFRRTQSGKLRVNTGLLAEYFFNAETDKSRNKNFYIEDTDRNPTVYFYDTGKYHEYTMQKLYGRIKPYITDYAGNEIYKSNDTIEVARSLIHMAQNAGHAIKAEKVYQRNPDYINFKNGLYNINTGQLEAHNCDYISVIQIPFNWNPEAPKPEKFNDFLRNIFNNDPERITFIKQYIGGLISNINLSSYKKMVWLIGKAHSGKSQLFNIISRLLGDENILLVSIHSLVSDPFALARLPHARLVGHPENSGEKLPGNNIILKNLTGGDSAVEVKEKFKTEYSVKYTGGVMFCGNAAPKQTGDKSNAITDRIVYLDCENPVPVEKRINNYGELIIQEEAEGIIQECVAAFRKMLFSDNLFTIPQTSNEAIERYKAENSTAVMFYSECCRPLTEEELRGRRPESARVTNIRNRYIDWFAHNIGGSPASAKTFNRDIADYLGISKTDDLMKVQRTGSGKFIETNRYYIFSLTEQGTKSAAPQYYN